MNVLEKFKPNVRHKLHVRKKIESVSNIWTPISYLKMHNMNRIMYWSPKPRTTLGLGFVLALKPCSGVVHTQSMMGQLYNYKTVHV